RIVLRERIRPEVVIERDVFLEDDDQMLDRRCRGHIARIVTIVRRRGAGDERERDASKNGAMIHGVRSREQRWMNRQPRGSRGGYSCEAATGSDRRTRV